MAVCVERDGDVGVAKSLRDDLRMDASLEITALAAGGEPADRTAGAPLSVDKGAAAVRASMTFHGYLE